MKLKLYILYTLTILSLSANAQNDRYWSGYSSLSDNFSEANNWFGIVNPNSGDNLYFNNTLGFRHFVYSNYSTGSYFNFFISYNGAGGIKLYGDNTYAKKFENYNDENLLELSPNSATPGSREIGNRIDSDLEINPVGNGGILVSCDKISIDNLNGTRGLKVYGTNTLTINSIIYEKNGNSSTLQLLNAATVDLKGNSIFTGLTTVSAGILKLNASGGALKSGNDVKINGGTLRIMQSQTIGDLVLNSGTLQIDPNVTLTITGTYTATGGTIDNKGTIKFAGDTVTFPGLAFVNNGVINTLANIEAASSANLIINKSIEVSGTIIVSDSAVFDTSNHPVGGSGTNLTMTGTSKYRTRGSGSKPDASGTYLLDTNTTIEFYGTSATDIRYGAPIYYANIIVNGSNVSNAGTANGIRFQTAGTFLVKNGATFNINTATGFTGNTNTGINTKTNGGPIITLEVGSTIEYAKNGTNGNQTITPFLPAYSNLTVSGTGIKTTNATTINIGNDLTIASAQLTIHPLQTFEIKNNLMINLTGKLEVLDKGSLVMINDLGTVTNSGTTNIYRKTTEFQPNDYTYWSTPIVSTDIKTTFTTPFSFPNDWHIENSYEFIPANYVDADNDNFDDNHDDWSFVTTMTPGKGCIIMVPYRPILFPVYTQSEVVFSGKVNNGMVTTPIELTPAVDPVVADDDFNLVGNPYPSAISADAFINANISSNGTAYNTIEGTLYFWTHKKDLSSTNLGPDTYNYSQDDYAVYTLAGGIGTSGTAAGAIEDTTNKPLGYIASGQGFFVEAVNQGTLLFNNAMRVGLPDSANSQFYKSRPGKSKIASKDRIWLNLQNSLGMFSQQLVGYFNNTTLGFDNGYDGLLSDGGNYVNFYSFIDDKKYKIQGRSTFDENDQVRLGYFSAVAGTFYINIDSKEGVFTNLSTPVYLEDKLLNIIYDLKQSPYTFTTEKGSFNDRFILRYINKTLSNKDFETLENQVLVSNKNKQLKVNSPVETIYKVVVYDLLGRQLFKKEKVNSNELALTNFVSSQQTLLVKVSLQNGQTVTKKIIY